MSFISFVGWTVLSDPQVHYPRYMYPYKEDMVSSLYAHLYLHHKPYQFSYTLTVRQREKVKERP